MNWVLLCVRNCNNCATTGDKAIQKSGQKSLSSQIWHSHDQKCDTQNGRVRGVGNEGRAILTYGKFIFYLLLFPKGFKLDVTYRT